MYVLISCARENRELYPAVTVTETFTVQGEAVHDIATEKYSAAQMPKED
jgi:hypothetical protein